MVASRVDSHLQLKEQLWLAETLRKMIASIVGSDLQFKEPLWLAKTDGYFGGGMGHFCLLDRKHNTLDFCFLTIYTAYQG